MSEDRDFTVDLELAGDYRIGASFDQQGAADLLMDEPPPLGEGTGPNAARVLGAAVGDCLAASLLFCLRRSRVEVISLRGQVRGRVERNEKGRFRIAELAVRLEPVVAPEQADRMERCLELFEDFCIVTASVRQGIDVKVDVVAATPAEKP